MQLRSRTARGENLGQTGNLSQPHMGSSVKLQFYFFFKAYLNSSETNRKWKDSVDGDVCLPCKKSSLLFVSLFLYFEGGRVLADVCKFPEKYRRQLIRGEPRGFFFVFFWQPNSGLSKFTLWGVWSILLFFASTIRIKISKCTPPPPFLNSIMLNYIIQ